jgi:8-oxo-dGTP pyrophosphatase MutT (NUDIX family)
MTTTSNKREAQIAAECIPTCNNTSVGMIVERDGQYLLFRRVKKPWGYAPSAGHVDEVPSLGHPGEAAIYEQAARRELLEEVGLIAERLDLVWEGITRFPCRRSGGDWHKWRVYRASVGPDAQPIGRADESHDLAWYWPEELAQLADRTISYLAGQISEADWEICPGLEPVWLHIFNELHLL